MSSNTKESRALKEEIEYGVSVLGLPLIIVYPELSNWEIGSGYDVGERAMKYWEKLPCLKKIIRSVPSVHVPLEKDRIQKALEDTDFMIQHKHSNFCWRYSD